MFKSIKGISGSTLKIIAILTMTCDHVGAILIEPVLENVANNGGIVSLQPAELSSYATFLTLYGILRSIGRLAFILFCFLLVEGFIHTSNKIKYTKRLILFSLLSEIPFDLAVAGKVLEFGHQNVFFTFSIAMVMMILYEKIDLLRMNRWIIRIGLVIGVITTMVMSISLVSHALERISYTLRLQEIITMSETSKVIVILVVFIILMGALWIKWKKQKIEELEKFLLVMAITAGGFLLSDLLNTDYSGYGVLAVAAMYFLRGKKIKGFLAGYFVLCFMTSGELEAIFAIIPVALYNGNRGLKLKYIFYIFYPAHLLILYFIGVLCRMNG
jgi:hypothetical protein